MFNPAENSQAFAAPSYSAVATIYDELMGEVFETRQSPLLNQSLDRLEIGPPGRWADLACGTGKVAQMMAREGWRVRASDLSGAMLEQTRRACADLEPPVTILREDMRRFAPEEKCDVVSCYFDSLNILTRVDDLEKTFRAVARALRPGGVFLFDVVTPYQTRNMWDYCDRFHEGENYFGVWEVLKNEPRNNIVSVLMRWFIREKDNLYRRHDETHRIRGYSLEEIVMALENAGLKLEFAYDGDEGFLAPPQDDTMRLDFAARKKS